MLKLCISAMAEIQSFSPYFGQYLLSIFQRLSICLLKYILSGPISAALIVSISGVLIHILKLHVSAAISGQLNVLNSVSILFGPEIHTESYFFRLHFI